MLRPLATLLLAASPFVAPATAQVAFFDIGGKPPARVFVYFPQPPAPTPTPAATPGPQPGPTPTPPNQPTPAPTPKDPPSASMAIPAAGVPDALPTPGLPSMAYALMGGVELTREQISTLRRTPGPEAKAGTKNSVENFATVTAASATGEVARFQVARGAHAEYFVSGDTLPKLRQLKPEFIDPLAAGWTCFAGPWDNPPALLKPGAVVEIPAELHRPAFLWLDNPTLRSRGLDGPRMIIAPAERALGDSAIFIRIPKGYSPRTPVGLLVWIDPSPAGQPPEILAAAADRLGLAIVGTSNNGNDRNMVDRAQRTLDAVATTLPLVHIDRDRVYATGMSGGGRMSSIMVSCFPEVFTGSVSMAGIAYYRDIPTPEGKIWPGYFRQPTGKRWAELTKHRLASITGTHDYNHAHSLAACEALTKDGLQALPVIVPVIGHELPPADRYLEALTWVDEPQTTAIAQRAKAASDALGKMPVIQGDPTEAQRKALCAVMEQAPWSPAAWKAADLLGLGAKK